MIKSCLISLNCQPSKKKPSKKKISQEINVEKSQDQDITNHKKKINNNNKY